MAIIQKFDNIKDEAKETMNEFDEKFSNKVIEFSALGKSYINRDVSLKVMRAFSR